MQGNPRLQHVVLLRLLVVGWLHDQRVLGLVHVPLVKAMVGDCLQLGACQPRHAVPAFLPPLERRIRKSMCLLVVQLLLGVVLLEGSKGAPPCLLLTLLVLQRALWCAGILSMHQGVVSLGLRRILMGPAVLGNWGPTADR